MNPNTFFTILFLGIVLPGLGQNKIDSFRMMGDVKVTIDAPSQFSRSKTILVIYALPNGNTTEQTMGKKIQPGDDWHFDIQHIRAQTAFVRNELGENIIVAYLENNFKSWPLWKQKHAGYEIEIRHIVDTLVALTKAKTIYLNGHSGGGSFIFGYIDGSNHIPSLVERITFLDSNYGYDPTYYPKFKTWLKENRKATLTVFAYNDSVALYNGKPIVSAHGGTWYKSHAMLRHLQDDFKLRKLRDDSLVIYEDKKKRIGFFSKPILHKRSFIPNRWN